MIMMMMMIIIINDIAQMAFPGSSFNSTNERSHWIKDNISNPNLNNTILLKNANPNNRTLLKTVTVQQPMEYFLLRIELYYISTE